MRRSTTGEVITGGAILLTVGGLSGCGSENSPLPGASVLPSMSAEPSRTSISAAPRTTLRAIGATVINGKDHTGNSVGVRSYASPWSAIAVGIYREGEQFEVLCVTPGRPVIDSDVPSNTKPVESSKWYKLNTGLNDWMGDGYVRPAGEVPACPPEVVPLSPSPVVQERTTNRWG